MKNLLSYGLLFSMAASCVSKSDDCCVLVDTGAIPLDVGNYWIYEPLSNGSQEEIQYQEKVDKTITINDKPYARVIATYSNSTVQNQDTLYYRSTDKGETKVLADQQEQLLLKTHVQVGDHWSYRSGIMTFQKTDVYVLNGKTYNCLYFSYDDPDTVDEETTLIVLPNVGILARIADQSWVIKKAWIKGEVIDF